MQIKIVCICVSDCIRTANGALFWVDNLYWCVSDCIRTANGAQFWFDSIGVLATVSGQQMVHCSGLTFCIGVLATVSGQQMAHSSSLT